MIQGITNRGSWQCVDMGVWQSGCYVIVLGCGKLQSRPITTGQMRTQPVTIGQLKDEPVTIGEFGTHICED